MDLTQKQKKVKYLSYCALILLADLIQNVSGIMPEIFGARCFIIIPAVVILSVGEDEIVATLMGIFAGLLWDLTSSVHMGFNFVFFAIVCFIASALVNHLIRDTFITNMLLCAIAIAIYCVVYWLFFIVIRGVNGGFGTLFSFYLPCAIYTAVITPIVYLIYRKIKKKLNAK